MGGGKDISVANQLEFLDGLRGIAAFYVLVYHTRELLFEGFHVGARPDLFSPITKAIAYGLITFSFAHQAVLFFFVLSGFVIHLRYARALKISDDGKQPDQANDGQPRAQKIRFDWFAYLKRRLKRLVPPLGFAIFLTIITDWIGIKYQYLLYQNASPYAMLNAVTYTNHHPLESMGNLLFGAGLQTWGSNNPLWSLRSEFWFYILYPVFWWLSRWAVRVPYWFVLLMWVIGMFWTIYPLELIRNLCLTFPVWWLGATLADIYTGRLSWSLRWVQSLALLLMVLPPLTIMIVDNPLFLNGLDILWGLGFFGLLAGLLHRVEQLRNMRIWKWFKPLGDCSYTLYVIHYPILVLMSGWLMSQSSDGTLPRHPLWIPVGVVLCLSIAYPIHFVVERPFLSRRSIK